MRDPGRGLMKLSEVLPAELLERACVVVRDASALVGPKIRSNREDHEAANDREADPADPMHESHDQRPPIWMIERSDCRGRRRLVQPPDVAAVTIRYVTDAVSG